MTTFDKRQKDEETKYKRDEELKFKVNARRNKLLGLWAAEQMAFKGTEAEAYAKQVVASDFERPGDADVLDKVLQDLRAKGVNVDEHRVRKEMTRLLDVARQQLMTE
ncbi:MAG: DUF1476 domain-containing protein [Alphaproteobacteria bacterium]|nr:DUF1476 domain-containing protein [Alphaproteobacteria bacterium]